MVVGISVTSKRHQHRDRKHRRRIARQAPTASPRRSGTRCVMPASRIDERDLVRRLLPLGAFDQRDHAVEEGGARRGGDPHLDPVGEHGRAAGDGRAVAAGLADDGRGLAGDGASLTEAMPSTTSPSPGIESPASTSTTSPTARSSADTFACSSLRSAIVEPLGDGLAARAAQAVGLRLAAPFGDGLGEIGEQHREPEPGGDLAREQRRSRRSRGRGRRARSPAAATTSVTKITGLRTSSRGSSLLKASRTRRRRIAPSNIEHGRLSVFAHGASCQKVLPASIWKCSTMGPRASAGKILQAAEDQDHADQQADEQRPVGREGAGRGAELRLGGQRAGDRHHRHDVGEAAEQHRDAERRVVPGRVGGEAGEGRAVVAGRRRVGVEDLGQAVRAGIEQAGEALRDHGGDGREAQDRRAAGSAPPASPSSSPSPRSSCRGTPACGRPSGRRRRRRGSP